MPRKLKGALRYSNIIFMAAWLIWSVTMASAMILLVMPLFMPAEESRAFDGILMITLCLFLFALIKGGATVVIRRWALMRPFQSGIYTPQKGPIRFLIIHLFNWFCCESIMVYGLVIYYMSGLIWPVFLFGVLGVPLFFYHRPSLKPFSGA